MSIGRRRRPPIPAFVRQELYRRAGAVPSFHIAPASRQTAADLITGNVIGTYNSATPAMAVGPDGLLFQPVANAPVIEYDPTTLACRGARIWSAVTNLLLNSATLSTQSRSVTAQSYTLHFTGTGTVTLSGASTAGPLVGTGTGEANRVSLTFTPTAGTLTLTVSGTVSNAQLNTGTRADPYVPTTSTAASSTADVWSITGADTARIINPAEFTVFVRGRRGYAGAFTSFDNFVALSDGTASNVAAIYGISGGSNVTNSQVFSAGTGQTDFVFVSVPTTASFTAIQALSTNDSQFVVNGTFTTQDTTVNMPVGLNKISIGSDRAGSLQGNYYIEELAIFRSRRPNGNIAAMP